MQVTSFFLFFVSQAGAPRVNTRGCPSSLSIRTVSKCTFVYFDPSTLLIRLVKPLSPAASLPNGSPWAFAAQLAGRRICYWPSTK